MNSLFKWKPFPENFGIQDTSNPKNGQSSNPNKTDFGFSSQLSGEIPGCIPLGNKKTACRESYSLGRPRNARIPFKALCPRNSQTKNVGKALIWRYCLSFRLAVLPVLLTSPLAPSLISYTVENPGGNDTNEESLRYIEAFPITPD